MLNFGQSFVNIQKRKFGWLGPVLRCGWPRWDRVALIEFGFLDWIEALSAFSWVETGLLTTVLLWRWFGSRLVVSFRIVYVLSLTISFRLWGLCAVKVVKYDFSWNGLFSYVNIYIFSSPMAASSFHWRLGLEVSGASLARLLVVLGSRLISELTPWSTPRASGVSEVKD